ncbi:rpsT, partial [Symbiodinium necroappetens]
ETIDEVTVQGVLHRNTAAKRKDRSSTYAFRKRLVTVCAMLADMESLFRGILRACIKKDLLPERSDEDRFTPAYKLIGYTLPECNFVREPRPWQLPGWKSPWMLKWEWEKWRKLTGRK